jgi:hypothetical protein
VECFVHLGKIQWPDANFGDLEGVEDVHGDGVCSLVGEVTAYPAAETLEGLTDVDWLAVVIIERVDAPSVVADAAAVVVGRLEEGLDLLADDDDVRGRT